MKGDFVNIEPLQSPQNLGNSIIMSNDDLLKNFKNKQSQLLMLDKVRISNEQSEQSIGSQDSEDYYNKQGFSNTIWKQRSLNIIVLVAKFVTYLLTNSDKFKLRYLDHKQFKVIGDKAADFHFYLSQKLIRGRKKQSSWIIAKSKMKQSLDCLSFLGSIIKPIQPNNIFKLYWDVIVFLILLINIIYIPLKISFEFNVVDGADFFLDTIPQYIFLGEMLLNFNVAYYSKGVLVLNRGQIFKHYLKGKFVLDVIVLIPFMIGRSNLPYIEFILLFRVSRVMYIFENIVETLNLRVNFASAIDIISLMSTFLFASHLIACVWHFIAIQESAISEQTWIQRANLQDEDWINRYITSFYWACITTLTIGYGDIIPVTQFEKLFVIFVALLSSIIFGYTISSIGQIFAQMSENKNYLRDRMTMIDSFVKKRGLNKELQTKVKKFFEYYLKQERDTESECEKLMIHLSGNLNKEVKIDFYKSLLLSSKLIKNNFSNQFVEKLCILVKEQTFVPEEIISIEGSKVDRIYFILRGEVEAYISNNKIIKTFRRNQVLDEKSFISQHPALFSTRAVKFSKLAYITFEDLEDLLKNNQEDREHFFQVKHQIEFGGRVKLGGCELCYQNHDFTSCPFVFYTPNKLRLFRKNIHDDYQQRKFQSRNKTNDIAHYNTLFSLRQLQSISLNYLNFTGMLNDIDPTTDFFQTNKQIDSQDDQISEQNSENNDSDKQIQMASQNILLYKRKSSDNKEVQSIKSKRKQTRISIQKNTKSGSQDKDFSATQEKKFSQVKRPTIIINQDEDLPQQYQQNQFNTGITQGQNITNQYISQIEIDQTKFIEIEIARLLAQKECNIDCQKEMLYYDIGFNLESIINKLKIKKRPIKFRKKKVFRKSFARSQSIRKFSQTRS